MAAEEQAGPVAEKAAELLEQLRQMLEAGGGFVAEQAPPLAAEIVTFGRVMYTGGVVALLLVLMLTTVVLVRKSKRPRFDPFAWLLLLVPVIPLIPCSIFATMAWTAPRLYILTCIKGLL